MSRRRWENHWRFEPIDDLGDARHRGPDTVFRVGAHMTIVATAASSGGIGFDDFSFTTKGCSLDLATTTLRPLPED